MDPLLYKRLKPVVRRIQFRRVTITLALIWIATAVFAGVLFYQNQLGNVDTNGFWWWLAGGALVASIVGVISTLIVSPTTEKVAAEIERLYPELDAQLITAMEQQPEEGKSLGFLQQDVLRKAITHSYNNRWTSLIPGWHLVAAPVAGLIGLLALVATMICLIFLGKPLPADPTIAFEDAVVDATDFQITVEPGNTEVERGKSLLVMARFSESIPPDASLVFTKSDGSQSRLPMTKSLDDPVFGARISSIGEALKYQVEFADQATEEFEVSVFEYPDLVRADALLKFPAYVEMENKVVPSFRRVNAVRGTVAELAFFVNKPVTSAVLFPKGDGEPVALVADADDPLKLTVNIEMLESRKYELELIDDSNRENRSPPKFVLNVLENKPPNLKLLAPGRDIDASPIEEIQMAASAWDDFGLKSFGVSYGIPGGVTEELELEQQQAGSKRMKVEHLLELEKLQAKPDDLVTYHFWAEDIGPDGQPRRVESDMFFAEVRHFDEIFRQGQAPPSGPPSSQQSQQPPGGNAQEAQELAELQKEIINGTWRVIRREKTGKLTEAFGPDSKLLAESQGDAIEKLKELEEKLEDPKSKAYVEPVRAFMNEAVLNLTQANQDSDASALKPSMVKEQAAYQGLLKLRAREHEVVLQQQQQQQAGKPQQQNNRSQQQLDQLNIKEDENRYENEKTAQQQSEEQQAQQEDRQVLSRLRELARRQNDLNERVKELQSALEQAETEEEKEEIERRLKSLQEQQEQMLRDTEELLERMQTEENQQRMSEQAEQLEETRENLQKAAEALDQNEASRAAAEGTRAQRELEELRDEFQNRASGQFNEQMKQMRNQAQDLEKKQEEISKQLSDQPKLEDEKDKSSAPSLRDEEEDKPDLEKQLADQKRAVEDLRNQMRETIEEAEPVEPLLAEELYETYRDSEVTRPDEALESARRSVSRGWNEDAQAEEQRAREGIEKMREGIEKAAESVLGDETEALKAAREALKGLNQELQDEIEQRDGSNEGKRGEGEKPEEGENAKGEGRSESGQPAEKGEGQNPSADSETEGKGRGKGSEESEENPDAKGQGGQQPGNGGQGQGKPSDGEPNSEPSDGQSQEGQNQNGNPGGNQNGGANENPEQQGRNAERNGQEDQQRPRNPQPGIRNLDDNGGNQNQAGLGGNRNPQFRSQPLTGDDFRDWSDRLRDVEEMVADPELRAEASRIREQAREIRKDLKRHSEEPNWDLIKMKVAKPLVELQDRVAEEIMRRNSDDALIPLDRDPVPPEYQDAVRRYYERLGSGK